MLFWKKRKDHLSEKQTSGQMQIIDGYRALVAVETVTSEVVGLSPEVCENTTNIVSKEAMPSLFTTCLKVLNNHNLAVIAGSAMTGCRTTAIIKNLKDFQGEINNAVNQRLPLIVNLICDGERGHGDYYSISQSGVFELFATNVQEAVDLTLISHRIAELALNPGVCAQDAHTAHSLQQASLADLQTINSYLGLAETTMAAPTKSQEMLFGDKRRTIPQWCDVDHPATLGTLEAPETFCKAAVAKNVFFFEHLTSIAEQSFVEFAKLTGRRYDRACGYRLEDAQYVLVAQGAVIETLRALVDILREEDKLRVGVVNLTMFRPFPGETIAKLLKGKKAVTVMEHMGRTISEDMPMLAEVRCALDRAIENGIAKNRPHPAYPVYANLADRPQLFSCSYGLGGYHPSFAELKAVCANMLSSGKRQKSLHLGPSVPSLRFGTMARTPSGPRGESFDLRSFPTLEILHHNIEQNYPQLREIFSCQEQPSDWNKTVPDVFSQVNTFALDLPQGYKGLGDCLLMAFAKVFGWKVKSSFPVVPDHSSNFMYIGAATQRDMNNQAIFDMVDVAVFGHLAQNSSYFARVKPRGVIVSVDTIESGEQYWKSLPQKIQRQIRDKSLICYHVFGTKIVQEIAKNTTREALLLAHVKLGAMLAVAPYVDSSRVEEIHRAYREQMTMLPSGVVGVEECMLAMTQAIGQTQKVEWQNYQDNPPTPGAEISAPWTVQQVKQSNNNVWDISRFWKYVGYFYTHRQHELLTDPFVGVDIIPARSSAFRSVSCHRKFIPQLISELCTGCGKCWAICPDSAIPGALLDISMFLQGAIQQCKSQGHEISNLPRLEKHLVQQAYHVVLKDDTHQYRTLGVLMQAVFIALLEKIDITADQKNTMSAEFQKVHAVIEHLPIVRTETFFLAPEKREKGTGALLSLVVNPHSCKGCMACVAVCPHKALEPTPQTENRLTMYRKNWDYFQYLPVNRDLINRHTQDARPENQLNHLLDKKAYFTMVGGDPAAAGSGEKTAIHMASAAVEAVMSPRFEKFTRHLVQLAQQLEQKIQELMNKSVEIRNWEGFAQNLGKASTQELDSQMLAQILGTSGQTTEIQKDRLQRMVTVLNEIKKVIKLYQEGENGTGRSRMMMVSSPQCMDWGRCYPYTPYSFPCTYHPDPAGVSLGMLEGLMHKLTQEFKYIRIADLERTDSYNSKMHDKFFASFSWHDFSAEEHGLCPKTILVEDSKTANWEAIFSILAYGLPIKIFILDRSGDTLHNVDKYELPHWHPALFFLLQKQIFVLQTSIGFPEHLVAGVMEGVALDAPAVFYIYAPEPERSPDQAALHARLAVESRVIPLWKYNPQMLSERCLSLDQNPNVEYDWATRFKSTVMPAHWALKDTRWRNHYQLVPKSQWHSKMRTLDEYLASLPSERRDFTPVIEADEQFYRVSETLVRFSEECLAIWHLLHDMARKPSAPVVALPALVDEHAKCQAREQEIRAEFAGKLDQLEKEHGAVYQQRLKNALLAFCKPTGGDWEALRIQLQDYVNPQKSQF